MKTPSDNLYRLVHSMTAAEKRYFKRHYASGKNMLTELFDFLNSLSEYNEESVKQHFAGSKLVKNLKVYKVQLTDILLKSLTSYNYKNNVRSRIHCGLEEIRILLDKQLYDIAKGKIKKLKQLCQLHEEYNYLLSVLKLEAQFHTFYNINPGADLDHLLQEIEEMKNHVNKEVFLQKTSYRLLKQYNQGKGPEDIEDYSELLAKVEALEPKTLVESHFRHQSLATLYGLQKNTEKELYHKKAGVQLFDGHKDMIPNKVSLYFSAIHNYLSACNVYCQFEDFDQFFAEIQSLPAAYPSLDRNFIYIFYLKIRSLFKQKKFQLIDPVFEADILKMANKYEMDSPLILSSTYLHLAVVYLYRNNIQKALHYLREVETNHLQNPPPIQIDYS